MDLVLLRLWCRLAAIALIRPLAWEPPYAAGVAQRNRKKTKKKKKRGGYKRSSHCGAAEMNPIRNREVVFSIPSLAQWVKDPALP